MIFQRFQYAFPILTFVILTYQVDIIYEGLKPNSTQREMPKLHQCQQNILDAQGNPQARATRIYVEKAASSVKFYFRVSFEVGTNIRVSVKPLFIQRLLQLQLQNSSSCPVSDLKGLSFFRGGKCDSFANLYTFLFNTKCIFIKQNTSFQHKLCCFQSLSYPYPWLVQIQEQQLLTVQLASCGSVLSKIIELFISF